jgi:hypothetical protein
VRPGVLSTCLSTRCVKVDCSDKPGTSCDVTDGTCKCGGTGGLSCSDREVCDPNARTCVLQTSCTDVACSRNQICDVNSGKCLCGLATCSASQVCSVGGDGGTKACVANVCTGVTCAGNTACDPADGYCKCNGVLCQSGETCACPAGTDGGACLATARACKPGTACTGVDCGANNTTCDPIDGRCKCGGPGGQACSSAQVCVLGPPAQCEGGQQCIFPDGGAKTCPIGTSCDPEDGVCKCGGRGGVKCGDATTTDAGDAVPAEVCVLNPTLQACRRPCDVRDPTSCPTGTFCYFDSSASTPVAYCSVNTDTKVDDQGCTAPTACFSTNPSPHGLHCNGLALGQTGICRPYCDVAAGASGCIQVPRPQQCIQILGAPTGYGYCQAQ